MKKVVKRIELLCRNAVSPHVIAARLHLCLDYNRSSRNYICVRMSYQWYLLPAKSDRLWRQKWRAFLTDHAAAVSSILCEHEPESRDALIDPVS